MGNTPASEQQPGDHNYERFGPVSVSDQTDTNSN